MLGDNGKTRYVLLHLTNHDDGRDLMKDCMWKVAPDGGYLARKSVDTGQLLLISSEPDLEPLTEWTLQRLKKGPRRWQDLHKDIRPELWRETHLNDVVRELRRSKKIAATDFEGKFSAKANPLLVFSHSD